MDKLAEEILHKNGIAFVRGMILDRFIKAMQEYHEAKLREAKIIESFETENQYVTDEDISVWVYEQIAKIKSMPGVKTMMVMTAKAMRDGLIKHR